MNMLSLRRIFDIVISLLAIIILFPLAIIICLWISFESKGGILYRQQRIGQYGKPFNLLKFRTMTPGSDSLGLLTTKKHSSQITHSGKFLRRYKLDELPQFINVLFGDMSVVGPRPEVSKFVNLYTEQQKTILNVKPGITDYASIVFRNESEILEKQENPEKYYLDAIMPEKILLNKSFINNPSLTEYFRIIFMTFKTIISGNHEKTNFHTS